jgi:hypothetical protein
MKAVLPKTTLTQEVPLQKIESPVQTTDILQRSPLVLPKTDNEAVFESRGIAYTSNDDIAGSVSK